MYSFLQRDSDVTLRPVEEEVSETVENRPIVVYLVTLRDMWMRCDYVSGFSASTGHQI